MTLSLANACALKRAFKLLATAILTGLNRLTTAHFDFFVHYDYANLVQRITAETVKKKSKWPVKLLAQLTSVLTDSSLCCFHNVF